MHLAKFAAAVCLACLAACGPKAESPPKPEAAAAAGAAAGACSAAAAVDWAPLHDGDYHIEAKAAGPTCDAGTATLTVTDNAGTVLYTGDHQIEPMTSTVFAEAKTPQKLQAALAEWIDPNGSNMHSTRALPDWAAGADSPMSGEFAFYPEEGTTRDAYLRLRAQDKPLYCFVQGGESMLCLVLDAQTGTLKPAGLQTFPG